MDEKIDHEDCVRCSFKDVVSFISFQLCVPAVTFAHLYLLSHKGTMIPDCGEPIFFGLPTLASGSLLCCLLSLFVYQVSSTRPAHIVPALFFVVLSMVYIANSGGLITVLSQVEKIVTDDDTCERSKGMRLFIVLSMVAEWLITLGCAGLLSYKAWTLVEPAKKDCDYKLTLVALGIYSIGFLVNQFLAPMLLEAGTFPSLFLISPSAHIDFVLETVCLYLVLLEVRTTSREAKFVATVIVLETMFLKWPSFGVDVSFFTLSRNSCEDEQECLMLDLSLVGLALKFVAFQCLGLLKCKMVIKSRCSSANETQDDPKEVPLLQPERPVISQV